MSENSFDARAEIEVGGRSYEIYRLDALQSKYDVARLPYALKVLLENLLRNEDGRSVTKESIAAVAGWLAYRIYGEGQPERDPTLNMGAFSTALENKLWLDDAGYRGIVVPFRDRIAPGAYRFDQSVIETIVKGAGSAKRPVAATTYATLVQNLKDGTGHGRPISRPWWGEKLRWIQSGNVQRYAGAMFAGVVILVLIFASS
jgi:hypothetical protein